MNKHTTGGNSMWTRKELKTKAKLDLKLCYWKAVLASIILGIASGSSGSSASRSSQNAENELSNAANSEYGAAVILAVVLGTLLIVAISIAVKVFLLNPLSIGAYKFFVNNTENSEKTQDLADLSFGFKNNYKNTVFVLFMKNLFVALWSLLFIIPGIVKAYQYRMVSYIIGDDPDMSYQEALQVSKSMMDGNKWKSFVLDLSFIGWYLLCGLTLGILAIFYVGPYVNFTNAELYKALKEN